MDNDIKVKRGIELIDVFNFFFGGIMVPFLKRATQGLVDGKADEILKKKIEKMEEDDPRGALFKVLLTMGKEEIKRWTKRHQEARDNYTENTLVQSIGKALPRKKDGSLDWDKSLSMMDELVSMDKEKFDSMVEFLNHDPIFEFIKKGWYETKKLGPAILDGLYYAAGFAAGGIERFRSDVWPWICVDDIDCCDKYPRTAAFCNSLQTRPGLFTKIAKRLFR